MKRCRSFLNPYRKLSIAAGESALIYEEKLAGPEVGFWKFFANSYYGQIHYMVYVDGGLYQKVERIFGEINNPAELKPPVVIKRSLRIWGFNNSTATHIFEVYASGEVYYEDG